MTDAFGVGGASPTDVLLAIARAQTRFIVEQDPRVAFDGLLEDLLKLGESEYGFIGEVLYDVEGKPYLKTHAITNIAWNAETQAFYNDNVAKGLEFRNLESLFGKVMTTSKAVIANDPAHDPRRGGIPKGHPALDRFLGLPIHLHDKLIGMVGLSNRPDGYSEALVESLKPLLVTIGQLLDARRRETDRAITEARHTQTLRQLAEAQRIAKMASWEWRAETGKLVWSQGAYDVLGYAHGALDDGWASMYRIIHPGDLVRVMAASAKSRAEMSTTEIEHRAVCGDGSVIHVLSRAEPQLNARRELVGIIGSLVDITERKLTEEVAKQAHNLLRQASEIASLGTWEKDFVGGTVTWSETMCKLYRLPYELAPRSFDEARRFIHPDDMERVGYPERQLREPGRPLHARYRVIRHDGVERVFESSWELIDGADGTPARAVGVTVDVSDYVRAVEEANESREKLAIALQSTGLGTWIMDVESQTFQSDEIVARMFKFGDGPIKMSLNEWGARMYPGDVDTAAACVKRCVEGIEDPVRWRARVRSGDDVWVHCESVAKAYQRNANGDVVRILGTTKDISREVKDAEERERMTRQMEHAQKLESLGVLAGGIAHDFNNLLAGMLGYASLAMKSLEPGHPASERLSRVQESAERAAELTKQMLAYSGKGRFVVEALDLSHLVEGMVKLLEISVSKSAVLKLQLGDDLPVIEADAAQIRQVVMNLITNASDAIGTRSGVITVSTGVMYADKHYLAGAYADPGIQEGYYTYVEVADTGIGMDRETVAKIFDPFFTTKFTGRGLGLSAVLGIVRGHRGAIRVYSELRRGTTFKVLLPSQGKKVPKHPTARIRDLSRLDGVTALVVDDEETIRSVTAMMLEDEGARVMTAADGREAVAIYREKRAEIDFVLLDMTMPHMDGEATFRELRRLNPGVRVLLCSGYNEQDATNRFAGKGLAGFIQKPFRYDQLLKKVRDMLLTSQPADGALVDQDE